MVGLEKFLFYFALRGSKENKYVPICIALWVSASFWNVFTAHMNWFSFFCEIRSILVMLTQTSKDYLIPAGAKAEVSAFNAFREAPFSPFWTGFYCDRKVSLPGELKKTWQMWLKTLLHSPFPLISAPFSYPSLENLSQPILTLTFMPTRIKEEDPCSKSEAVLGHDLFRPKRTMVTIPSCIFVLTEAREISGWGWR